ncbi:DUF6175 family protein [Flavobacterium sp.]|uniref:DUF6175 family protein n=1 Tax=Flavobacterium sp. TaxID=239 RepID=UPI003D0AB0D1
MKNINKLFYAVIAICMLGFSATVNAQAKKPTIMIVPSDVWCNQNGFMKTFYNQEEQINVPDYKRAFQENSDLLLVISKINGLMAQRGFPLKNLESEIKSLEAESAEDALLTSKNGAEVAESPIDKLRKNAKADIIMQLTWVVKQTGPKKLVEFTLQGLDSYTNKEVASAGGAGAPSFSAEVSTLLEEAVLNHIDKFNASLQTHFDDMFANGREIKIRLKKFNSWDGDFEKEYAGKELSEVVEEWMAANTVKGRFNTTTATENMMLFEQARIPLYDEKGNATDARKFVKNLQKFLQTAPYAINVKLMSKGLGEAVLVLGDK